VKMNTDIKDVLAGSIIYLATASKTGIPNVVPIGGKKVIDDQTLLIVDVLLNRTKKNIIENPTVAIIVEDLKREKPCSYQLKGKAEIHTNGDYLQQAISVSENAFAKCKKAGHRTKYKVRSAVLVTVEEIFSNMYGGRKISEEQA
jgi:predicted pyridoxine 5'-phosphate oxidase superfamily flavin-nucleotide-binding protein